MSRMVKVQLPLKEELKLAGEKIAANYGLSSYQELIRFWTEQAKRGNLKIQIDDAEEILTPKQEAHLIKREKETLEAEKKGKAFVAHSLEEMMNQLNTPIDR